MNENLYLYILMRTDLGSLGPGRAAAQASHAANAFWYEQGDKEDVVEWSHQTPQGFGTAIVLGVNYEQLKDVCSKVISQGFPCGSVIDPDYVITVPAEVIPCIDDSRIINFKQSPTDPTKYLYRRSEVTCAYIFGDKDELSPYLSEFPLYS